MSLQSAGCSFSVTVTAPRANVQERIPEIYHHTDKSSAQSVKDVFLAAMKELADSEHFEKLTHNLNNIFHIQVRHAINLKMPD